MDLAGKYADIVAYIENKVNARKLPVPYPGTAEDKALIVINNPSSSDRQKEQAMVVLSKFMSKAEP